LIKLYLSGDEIESLPRSIGQLKNLRDLHVSGRKLKGLPDEIGNLSSLVKLGLGHSIERLPPSIGQLKNLEILDLIGTKLKGLPDEIGGLTSLKDLDVSGNRCIERLPSSIGQCKNLESINVYDSNIFEIPDEVGNLTRLKILKYGAYPDGLGLIDEEYLRTKFSAKLRYMLACVSAQSCPSFQGRLWNPLPIIRKAPKLTHLALSRATHAFVIGLICNGPNFDPVEYEISKPDAIYNLITGDKEAFVRIIADARASGGTRL